MENSKKGLEGIIQKKTPWIIVGIVEIVVLVASILFAVGVFSSGQGGIPSNNSVNNNNNTAIMGGASAADPNQLPEGEHQQIISVRPTANGSELVLETMKASGEWESVFTCPAKISTSGTTVNKTEGDGKTPEGSFYVLFALSDQALDTKLQTYSVANGDVWVDDSSSKYYNTLQKGGVFDKDWSSAEDIYRYFSSGSTNAVIYFDYNGDGLSAGSATPGAGSAIFLYGRNDYSGATSASGDIYISAGDMTKLLSFLDSSKRPMLSIERAGASNQSDFIGGGPHAPDVLVSTVDELMLRTGPGTNYQAIAKLSKGDTFNSFESKDGWAHGYYGDLEGWVSEQYLTKSLAAVGDYSDYENAVAQFDPMHIAGTGIGPYNIVLRGEDSNYAYYQAYAGGGWECVKVSKTYPYPVEYMSASERAIYEDSPYN